MKKKTTVKKGPLGTPLGNPLGYFNSQKTKKTVEPKSLTKRQYGGMTAGPLDENTSKYLDARYPGKSNNQVLEKGLKHQHEELLRTPGLREDFNAGPMFTKEDVETVKPDSAIYKKGGALKRKK